MKEIIVIKKEDVIDNSITGVEREQVTFTEGCKKIEQVPETFEELKELCKQTGYYDDVLYPEYIFVSGLSFRKNGDIDDTEGSIVAENRTPAQMWQIIKALVEE